MFFKSRVPTEKVEVIYEDDEEITIDPAQLKVAFEQCLSLFAKLGIDISILPSIGIVRLAFPEEYYNIVPNDRKFERECEIARLKRKLYKLENQ